ncbi:RNA 2',3'-cyclic phosphodiesterase [Rhodovulum bhavnagarense]|nr:RNA 2',3'-cyclic phosphodiesterase [Rhodovulum bhavnagarense]
MIRAFAAIDLPGDVRDRLVRLQEAMQIGRPVPLENLHLTLVFLGELPEQVLDEVHLAFSQIRAEPFELTLSGLDLFGGHKPRVLYARVTPNPALEHLQSRLAQAARMAGAAVEGGRFVPHVTLAYLNVARTGRARINRAVVDNMGFQAGPIPVNDIALYRSDLGRGPARHRELARYPLFALSDPPPPA